MMRQLRWGKLSYRAALLLTIAMSASAQTYSVIQVTGFAGGAINDSGQVVGYTVVGGLLHAALYSSGTVTDLGTRRLRRPNNDQ